MANIPGLSGDTVANSGLALKWLDILSGTTYTGLGTTYVQLHNGQPGFGGILNVSLCHTVGTANIARKTLTWAAATNATATNTATKAITTTLPSWTGWDSGTDSITHVSVWVGSSAQGAGTFLFSAALTGGAKAVNNGDTLNLTALSLTLTPTASTT
jgi:hypothetical protein